MLDAGVRAANHYAKGSEMDPVKNVITPTPKASTQKRSNGQGSIYYVVNKQGRRILKASIFDINGKRRVKSFKKKSDAEDWLSDQKRARQHGENTYATNPKMTDNESMLMIEDWKSEKDKEGEVILFYNLTQTLHYVSRHDQGKWIQAFAGNCHPVNKS